VIVKPSLGLTQASTPPDRCPSAGPASKHAAAHLGVWNAEEGVARAIADRVNAVRASRTRGAARFNRLIVNGVSACFSKPRFLPFVLSLRKREPCRLGAKVRLDEAHYETSLRSREGMRYGHRQIAAGTVHRRLGRLLTRSLLFSDLVGAHACGVEIAVHPVELDAFSDRSGDEKGAR
jgi:hypothetical protein